jgi:hypothetical protein
VAPEVAPAGTPPVKNPAATVLGSPIRSAPVGVFVVKDGIVTWRPSLDLNKIILGGQVVGIVALLTIGSIVRAVLNRRAGSD